MRVNGVTGIKPRVLTIHFMTDDVTAVEFRLRPLTNADNFDEVMPKPVPPQRIMRGGERMFDYDDSVYKDSYKAWIDLRYDWCVLKCLDTTDDLHFDTVDMSDANTWKNWQTEFVEAFGNNNLQRVLTRFSEANSLSETGLDEARQCFLALRQPESGTKS